MENDENKNKTKMQSKNFFLHVWILFFMEV